MKVRDFSVLAEARIQEAAARGDLDNLPGHGRPLPDDGLSGLPYEDRIAALIHRSTGSAPEEVELLREIAALREALPNAKSDTERGRITEELKRKTLRLTLLFESSGRAALARSALVDPR